MPSSKRPPGLINLGRRLVGFLRPPKVSDTGHPELPELVCSPAGCRRRPSTKCTGSTSGTVMPSISPSRACPCISLRVSSDTVARPSRYATTSTRSEMPGRRLMHSPHVFLSSNRILPVAGRSRTAVGTRSAGQADHAEIIVPQWSSCGGDGGIRSRDPLCASKGRGVRPFSLRLAEPCSVWIPVMRWPDQFGRVSPRPVAVR